MIYLFTGTPGSGKSLHMSEIIYYSLRMKRPVLANFEINTSAVKNPGCFGYCPNEKLTPQLLTEFSVKYFNGKRPKEGELKLFIDECQIIFNSRDWNAPNRKEWIRFFTQHRKLGYDIYLVAQFDQMIDKQIRALVEHEVKHRKVNEVGLFGRVVNALFFGNAVCCAVTYWYAQKMRLSSEFFLGRKKFYRLYDTYAIFKT